MGEPDPLLHGLVVAAPVPPDRQDFPALGLDGDNVRRCDLILVVPRHRIVDVVFEDGVDGVVVVLRRRAVVGHVLHVVAGEADVLIDQDLRCRHQASVLDERLSSLGSPDLVLHHLVLVAVPGGALKGLGVVRNDEVLGGHEPRGRHASDRIDEHLLER